MLWCHFCFECDHYLSKHCGDAPLFSAQRCTVEYKNHLKHLRECIQTERIDFAAKKSPPSIRPCLFDSSKCHFNTEGSPSLARRLLPKSSCHLVHLLSPNMVNRTRLCCHSSYVCVCVWVAAEWLINISLALGPSVAKPIFTAHLSPLWLQPKTWAWKSQERGNHFAWLFYALANNF